MEETQHLIRAELDRLISDDAPKDAVWIQSATAHLEACRDCRLALLLGEPHTQAIPILTAEEPCPGEARLKRAASGASDAQTALHVVQHCASCVDCAKKLKEYSKLFSEEASGAIAHLKTSKPEWQKAFARQIASAQRDHSRRTMLGLTGWALSIVLLIALGVTVFLQRDSVSKINRLTATAFSESRTTDLRLPGADFSEPRTSQSNAAINNQSLAEARAAIARLRPSMNQHPEFLDAEARADLASNDVEAAYEKLNRARAQSPHSPEILSNLAITECLLGDNGQPERYQVSYQLFTQVLEKDKANVIALFNRALVSERLREYSAAIEDWNRFLEIESKSAWADEARRHKTADETQLGERTSALQSSHLPYQNCT